MHLRSKLISVILCILLLLASIAVCLAGTQYYLDPTCTFDGNGLATTCAASAGASGARNTCFTLSGTGTDLSIYGGTTLRNCRIPITANGTSGDHVTITSYNKGYQGLAKPILDGRVTQADSWVTELNSVYSSTNNSTAQINVLTVDGVRLKAVAFTNKASTVSAMTAGTYSTDITGHVLFVRLTTGYSPSGHLVQYSANTTAYYSLLDTYFSDVNFVDVSYLSFIGSQGFNTYLGYGSGSCNDCSYKYCDSTMSGERGFTLDGDRASVMYNTCSDNASEIASIDAACIAVDATTGEQRVGGEVAYNTVSNTRYGSCYEINGQGSNSGLDGTWFHNNTGTQCRSGLELYGCNTAIGCPGVTNSLIENNKLSYTGHNPVGNGYGRCMGAGYNSSYNTFRNNICVGFPTFQLHTTEGYSAAQAGHHNKFYNNTVYTTTALTASSYAGMSTFGSTTGYVGGSEWKNNVIYLPNGGRCIYTGSGATLDIFDKNMCYSASGNWAVYGGVAKATMADYKSAYTVATGLTDNSSNVDPNIDLATYSPNASSPAIAFGLTTLGVSTDYYGRARGATNDSGAVQRQEAVVPTKTIIGGGAIIRGAVIN